jgi:arylsulfatase A
MNRFAAVLLAMLACLSICFARRDLSAAEPNSTKRKPNVVLIVIDDLGWADLGCYGSKYYRTPNIDRLAAEGLRFTQAYAACPVCSPTRTALLTGKYPARVHLTDYIPGFNRAKTRRLAGPDFLQQLPLEEVTIAERLRDGGYATAAIGKWHLGGEGYGPDKQGFGTALGGVAAGSVRSHFAPYSARDSATLPGIENPPQGEYLADRLTAEAEKFMTANRDRPFFLYLPHYAVHTPIQGKPELVASYENRPPHGLQHNPIYGAMVENMDENVGRILKKLDELKLADNTLVLFTSDNGGLATAEAPNTPATNNAPLREGKGYLYEGGIRVALVSRWPGVIKPGSTCAAPVISCDLPVTIAEACRIKMPEAVDGVSLLPLLQSQGNIQRDALYWHYPHYSPQGGRPGSAIRAGDHKLIVFYEDDRHELYDVEHDISENKNLAEEQPDRVRQMSDKLTKWLKSVDAAMPRPNPGYEPDGPAEDGTIHLRAETAEIHGPTLRYEPLPHKNTLGFWTRQQDWASWKFKLPAPGRYTLEVLQGCANGSGGSEVEYRAANQSITGQVMETGGFQNFVPRTIGQLEFPSAGDYVLEVKPRSKPGPAVMDLREVRLIPTGK